MIPENIVKLLRSDIIEIAQLGVDWVIKNGNCVDTINIIEHLYSKFYINEDMTIVDKTLEYNGVYTRKPGNPARGDKYYDRGTGDMYIYEKDSWFKLMSVLENNLK